METERNQIEIASGRKRCAEVPQAVQASTVRENNCYLSPALLCLGDLSCIAQKNICLSMQTMNLPKNLCKS